MSGIISLINRNNEAINQTLLRRMTDYMAFSGPDAQQSLLENINQIDDVAVLESLVVKTISVNSPEDFQ